MTTTTRQSAAEKSYERQIPPTVSISAADSCAECRKPLEPRKYARGLCLTCYQRARRHGWLQRPSCKDCGRLTKPRHLMRGLCTACYCRRWRHDALPEPLRESQSGVCLNCDRPPCKTGLCWACYKRQWRARKRQPVMAAASELAAYWSAA